MTATNAQANARADSVSVFVNFDLHSYCFFLFTFFLVLAFFGFSLLSCHFWPFTEVLRKIFRSLTREVGNFARNR